ncbi:unknown protein [Seminavis robusta]|uniref:Uncharacterized protein n=1 Tax=Seminavis robusta TaxID=568900 RepID=A0A9N8E803_9STRA|nr:unknown protein [Seminavis robusta]|eukprot:Sro648_g181070.1 n/a (311) ;mRNA; r:30868-32019
MEPQKAIYKKEASTSAEIWKQLDQVVIPIRTKVEGNDDQDPVRIFSEFKPNLYPLNYENEIKIQTYVERLVMDAIACMGCTNKLQTNLEISFYGVTPDIILVFHRRKIIFVIEVKSPSVEAFGPLHLQQDSTCVFETDGPSSFRRSLGHAERNCGNTLEPEQQPTKDEQQHSPDPERKRASEKSLRFDKKQPATSFEPDAKDGVKIFKAFLYGSVTAEEGNVFRMLLLGLMTAKIEAGIGLRFAMTDDKLKVKNEFPHPNTKNFFLLDTIGSGGTGDVSLAVSLNGARAAVKFYRFKPSERQPQMNEQGR